MHFENQIFNFIAVLVKLYIKVGQFYTVYEKYSGEKGHWVQSAESKSGHCERGERADE